MSPISRDAVNLVIRASAGTGKTFQLSNRFLRLALDGAPLETILATTFTRKAAGEILDRVLLRLADAALDDGKLAALAGELERPGLDRAQCLDVLQTMIRQLHRLRVGTLDSVFIEMARSFSLELGLPPGWRIVDAPADRRLRAEAIGQVLQRESAGDVLRLMHLLTKGEATRSVTRQILDLVDHLYSYFGDAPAEAWSALARRKPLAADQLAAAVAALAAVALPNDGRMAKARAADVGRAEAGQWEAFLNTGLAAKVVDGTRTFFHKPLPDAVVAAYQILIDHATAELLGVIANQTEATRDMLARFAEAYGRLQERERSLRFDDVTRRLGSADGRRTIEQVVYRLDARLAHLLLDEFQDTSPAQWRVLGPFARRIVGRPADSFFCVGDVKQAIYGWRGGVAEILEAIADELSPLTAAELNQSYRSSPVVIDVVNRVFGSLAGNDALDKYQPAARAWAARFHAHSTARAELPGYCRLDTGPLVDQRGAQADATLDFAAGRIAELHAAVPGRSIGVLVRRNRSVARLIHRLGRLGVAASEEGGNPLTDSPAVQLALSALRLADHPGDTASRFHVARSPLGKRLGLERFDDARAAWRVSAGLRERLLADGYGPTLHEWTTWLAPDCDPRDLARLVQLVEMAYGYQPQATERADDFLDLVAQQKVEDPSSSEVRVMTIHQAKGLQFDAVVLPELDYPLLGHPPRLVVGRRRATEPPERVCRYVGEKLRPILPRTFAEMFEHDGRQRVEESLCLLYVAMTRAVHSLEIIIAPSRPSERQLPATSAGVLRAALAEAGRVEPESLLFEQGEPAWARTIAAPRAVGGAPVSVAEPSVVEEPAVIRLAEPAGRPRRGLDRRSPSQLEGGPRVELGRLLQFDADEALARGTIMHAWFEQIGWLDDGAPTDEQLLETARRHVADEEIVRRWMVDFREALDRVEVQAVLRRSTQDHDPDQVRLWRERPFAIRENNALLAGTMDRLIVCYQEGVPVSADVLDFKTDRLPPDDPAALAARVEFYRPQMEAYARAAASMFGLSPAQVSARLVFVEPGMVKRI
ncbi:MAG: UvrD-helicase domain-containing protein [Pirellulales bacterium]|nr:UvrD-helicase domain-containing protein [Pirellulales bacterium]